MSASILWENVVVSFDHIFSSSLICFPAAAVLPPALSAAAFGSCPVLFTHFTPPQNSELVINLPWKFAHGTSSHILWERFNYRFAPYFKSEPVTQLILEMIFPLLIIILQVPFKGQAPLRRWRLIWFTKLSFVWVWQASLCIS